MSDNTPDFVTWAVGGLYAMLAGAYGHFLKGQSDSRAARRELWNMISKTREEYVRHDQLKSTLSDIQASGERTAKETADINAQLRDMSKKLHTLVGRFDERNGK